MTNKTIAEMIGDEKLAHFIDFLELISMRWKDEKDYEDWEDYKASCEKKMGHKLVSMTKRPFGCIFLIEERKCYFKVKKNNIEYGQLR